MTGTLIYIPTTKNAPSVTWRHGGAQTAQNAPTGDTFEAVLTRRGKEHASLRTRDDFNFRVPVDSVKGQEGETLHFKIIKSYGDGMTLKQIFPEAAKASRPRGNAGLEEMQMHTRTLDQMTEDAEYRTESHREQQQKAAQAVSRIRRNQSFMSGNSGASVIAALTASGVSLDKVSFTTLSKLMQDVERLPDPNAPKANDPVTQALRNQGLAEIPQNKNALHQVAEQLKGPLPEKAIAELLRQELPVTPENIYTCRYAAGDSAPVTEAELAEKLGGTDRLNDEIAKCLIREGIANIPKNQNIAIFLLANNLPIIAENIEAVALLKGLGKISSGAIYDAAAAKMAVGESPASIDLKGLQASSAHPVTPELLKTAVETAEKLPLVTSTDVDTVASENKPLDLKHLIMAASDRLIEQAEGAAKKGAYTSTDALLNDNQQLITYKRQLAEIQLKLTTQAALRLAHQQIQIDTTPLRDLVKHLQNLETNTHTSALKAQGANNTQNVSLMNDIFRHIHTMRPLTANVHIGVHTGKIDFTIRGVHQAVLMARANQQYEAHATVPNPKYGDSFDKVRNQFEGLLGKLNIEPTNENIRAAFILSKNEMDVKRDSIDAVKVIDAKIETVANSLHPMVAAQMLKEGLSPLDMHMDDIIAYIRKYGEVRGFSGGEKIAQHILEMDRNKTLNSDQRAGLIAIYRMLNVIQKNGAAALGLAIKQNAPLTLGSLMEAAKVYDREKQSIKNIDVSIDDGGKHFETALRPPSSIRAAVETAAALPASYNDLLAEGLTDKAAPANLQDLISSYNNLEKPVEDLLRGELSEAPAFSPDKNLAADAIKTLAEAPPALIALLQAAGMPITAKTVQAVRRLSDSDTALADTLNELYEEFEEEESETGGTADWTDALMDSSLEAFKNGTRPKELTQRLWYALNNSLPTPSAKLAQSLIEVRESAGNVEEEIEDVPIMFNGKPTSLKIYTLNEEAVEDGKARTFISLKTENLGKVQGYFTFSDEGSIQGANQGGINLQFLVSDTAGQEILAANVGTLASLLNEIGLNISSLDFAAAAPPEPSDDAEAADGNRYEKITTSPYEFVV